MTHAGVKPSHARRWHSRLSLLPGLVVFLLLGSFALYAFCNSGKQELCTLSSA